MPVTYLNLALNDLVTGTTAGTVDTIYANTNGVAQINSAACVNNSGSSVLLSVYILASGVAATSVDPIWKQTIAAGETATLDGLVGQQVPNGGSIRAFAGTTNVLRITISGIEIV